MQLDKTVSQVFFAVAVAAVAVAVYGAVYGGLTW